MDKLKDNGEKDTFGDYVRLKVAKLSAAVYLVTNFLPDEEPLKYNLRKLAVSLKNNSLEQPLSGRIIAELEQVLSLIDLATFCAGVSKMNLSVLQTEYVSLKQTLLDQELQQELPKAAEPKQLKNSPNMSPNSRQTLILELIKHRGPSSIADIALGVKGVSSKTVQRELASLVKTGVLSKEGEKRWSRYSIAL